MTERNSYEQMQEAWVQAYKQAQGVENVRELTIRVAKNEFDEYWQQNYGEIPEGFSDE